MKHPEVEQFFQNRKEDWLKRKLKNSQTEDERRNIQHECEKMFSLEYWLPKTAREASQRSIVTHPCTFSHPSARKNKNGSVTPINYETQKPLLVTGFMSSDSVNGEADNFGNAGALPSYKFLCLQLSDGRPILQHLQEDTEIIQELFKIKKETYQNLKGGFMSMVVADLDKEGITSSRIKQVYFPYEDTYHQLSLLTNSGLVFALKQRIDDMRFSDSAKKARELKKRSEYSEHGFSGLCNLTMIRYGGKHPENISVLNKENGGTAYLLNSMPPKLQKSNVLFPKQDFFSESLYLREFKETLEALHKLLKGDYNNKKIRKGIDACLVSAFEKIIKIMWQVRACADSQQYRINNSKLPSYQKIWLHPECEKERIDDNAWLDKLCQETARWIIAAYKKTMGKEAIVLGDDELHHLLQLIKLQKEYLR